MLKTQITIEVPYCEGKNGKQQNKLSYHVKGNPSVINSLTNLHANLHIVTNLHINLHTSSLTVYFLPFFCVNISLQSYD